MDTCVHLTSIGKLQEMKDQMHEKLAKVRGIVACLMSAVSSNDHHEISQSTIYTNLWIVDDFLREIDQLLAKLENDLPNLKNIQPNGSR